jgi:hypothetical protein
MTATDTGQRNGKASGTRLKNLFRGFLLLVSASVLLILVRPAISEFYASKFLKGNGRAIFGALKFTGEDAEYSDALGYLYLDSHGTGDLARAAGSFRRALSKNPTDAHVWMALAGVYSRMGQKGLAEFATDGALARSAGDPRVVWESGVLFLQAGNTARAAKQFRRYIWLKPEEQEKVYELCITLGMDPGYMQENLVPPENEFLRRWLNFLINFNLVDAAAPAWGKLRQSGPREGDYMRYCDFLIKKGLIAMALDVWNDCFSRLNIAHRPGKIWNGDFELPMVREGFDWTIGSASGVRIFLDEDIRRTGQYSLSASFDGTSNPDIYLAREVIPVAEGHRYMASGYIKTSGITTLNGIFFEVRGYECGGLQAASETLTGTNFWKKETVEFKAPRGCSAVLFGIRRAASNKFDNKISGDVWIDSISLTDED